MKGNNKPVDYMASINKARGRSRKKSQKKIIAIAASAIVVAGIAVFALTRLNGCGEQKAPVNVAESTETTEDASRISEEESLKAEEEAKIANEKIDAVLASYDNLGFVQVSAYLNIRKKPDQNSPVIGKILDKGVCEILDSSEGWYHVSSGGIDGYVSSDYVLTGEEALEAARHQVRPRAVVKTDNLNIREGAGTDTEVLGQVLENERYEILGEENGFYQIPQGYISKEYCEEIYGLDEARKLDMRAMVLSLYDNPGVSNVTNYLNIREGIGTDKKIIGKLPSYAGCEILESQDGWHKIRSGRLTGYVQGDYILTGDAARAAAMDHAELMAITSTDGLNVRTEPSTDAKIWTQISSNERYHVLNQIDGWVEIEFDEGGEEDDGPEKAYLSSDYVEVRYALPEAVKFSPSEENASLRSRIVNYAMQFLGNPYVWGGTSLTRGADCSGFTMQVMKHFGINLPHYSGDQAKRGRRIKSGQMRPGDLIFYGNSRGRINHVAMYIGNGQIIHAASRRSGIKISSWNYRTPLRIVDVIGD